MAGNIENITIQAYRITGPCWRILKKQEEGEAVNILYSDKELVTPYFIQIADDLDQLFRGWKTKQLTFPASDIHIRIDKSISKYNLNVQVDELDLDWIEANFSNLVNFCKAVGIVRLVLRLFVAGKITLGNVQTVFIHYLKKKKSSLAEIQTAVNWLQTNGYINATQKAAFWANVNAALGNT